jgi:hypothetical protein
MITAVGWPPAEKLDISALAMQLCEHRVVFKVLSVDTSVVANTPW